MAEVCRNFSGGGWTYYTSFLILSCQLLLCRLFTNYGAPLLNPGISGDIAHLKVIGVNEYAGFVLVGKKSAVS
jgi:hypothetical protein